MSKPQSNCSRRVLLATMGAAAFMPAIAPMAEAAQPAADETAVGKALESLRMAIIKGDSKTLNALLHDKVIYAHSDGHKVQNKAEFVADLAGKDNYRSLTFSDVTILIVGNNALVRHTWEGADIMPDGSTGRSYIKVMQVWRKEGKTWKLFARQSCPIKS
ncbi:nuclear transport factor 2 family protein [Telmatospirillum sp.]|uniref:nuclear transport factor 2 family protein n=1 Tax=Telmatospirillum sp. TaxID=2079197 RepID=UPI00283FC9E1|nr:nuclear transport factor 2 family protein [Telmatospirillum sp.]MDR3441287.1 nuclear transport factor 2 family protein [Telmatospirillum sp.]